MTILIVLVVMGSSILLSFISYQRAKSSLVSQLEDNYAASAQKYALELTAWVSTNATIIDTLAAEIAVNGITFKGYDEFHSYLERSNELLNKNGYVYDVYFTYPDNYMVCASDFLADGTVDFVHEREWYTTSALTGELFFSTPYLDSDTLKPIITISKAVYKDGELLGVLAADIFVDVLVDMVSKVDAGINSYAFLLDHNMHVITHPDSAYDYPDKPIGIMDAPGSPYQSLVDSIRSGADGMVFVDDYDGTVRGIVSAEMINTGWYVCLATDRKELEKSVASLMRGFVIAAGVAILIGVAMAVFLARVLDQLSSKEQEYRQEVLRLEKQAADEASEAKSRFLADMSHEIRTPINTIIGMNEMILRETDNRDIMGYSRNIKQSGNNLLQLINGILDFSKIEDGKMEIVPVKYNVASQMTYLINSISERASAKNLELIADIDPGIPTGLFGDDTRINQVLTNLLTNAVKYTEKGSVTLRVTELSRQDENIVIRYEIADTGIGIRQEDMQRLFESFERLDVVRNRNIEGTGLGMTITRRLLELMGSELKVDSTYGKGSTFSFELAQKIEDTAPIGDYRKTAESTESGPSYKESFHAPDARILVVDDTKLNIFVVENLLKKTGLVIDTAVNGNDAIALAGENDYDVILMDQRMPGMDGTEAMQRIRAHETVTGKRTPIICLTADVISGARERYIEQGFDDYLTKPIDGTELEKMLIRYLPGEKVEMTKVQVTAPSGESPLKTGLFGELEAAGVDTSRGLSYSGGDEKMYIDVLKAYAGEGSTRVQKLEDCLAFENLKDYGIYIHALKSSSRTIGAAELSDVAARLEAAAKDGNMKAIRSCHDDAMEKYRKIVTVVRNNTGEASGISGGEGSGESDEQEIFEFYPE
ncbi:MAG: response regulator [Lachnospiraceae bacterium]|nr:response regulator [Lachnospiraceae bacterium]